MNLPPEISVEKRQISSGEWAFYFRHKVMGELGRIVVRGTPDGQSCISCELSGDPSDPMTEERAAIFKPLGIEIAQIMETAVGRGDGDISLPPPRNEPAGILENKLLQCPHCGTAVARLVFAPEATDQSRFEDYARLLFPSFAQFDMPTWIIGPDLAGGPPEARPADIMQLWPTRGPIRRLSPALFNPELQLVQEQHCSPSRGGTSP